MANDQKHVESFPAKEDNQKEGEARESHPIENIVLVGRTGNGKSATANSIARQKKVFASKSLSSGVTMECQTFRAVTPEGPILNIIDTPGLFDLSVSADFVSKEIVRCLTLADGGLNAVLLVLSVRNRITKEEELVLSTLQIIFGSKIVDYLIVVFSGGDVLEEDNLTLKEYLGDKIPDFLKRVLILCDQRMILFDNKTEDDTKKTKQVHELLNLINLVRKQNNNIPYTDDMYHKIKAETDRHRKEQEELEAKGHELGKVKEMKKELELTYGQNLAAMAEALEKNIKFVMETQTKFFEEREKSLLEKMEMKEKLNLMMEGEGCVIL